MKKKQRNIHIRLLRTISLYAPKSLFGHIVAALLAILVPYFTIFLSSNMIGSLEIRNFRLAMISLCTLSLINLANGCIQAFLAKWGKKQEVQLQLEADEALNQICRNVSFGTLEATAFQEDCQRAKDGLNYSGGFYEYLLCLEKMIVNLSKTGISVGFILVLLLQYNSWNSNKYIVILTSILCIFAFIRIRLNGLSYSTSSQFYEHLIPYNRQLQYFFMELLGDEKYAKEIHLYDIKGLISSKEERCHQQVIEFLKKIAQNTAKFSMISEILQGVLNGAIYLCVTIKCVMDHLGIGSILKYIGIVYQFSDSLSLLLNCKLDLKFKAGFLENFLNFTNQFADGMYQEPLLKGCQDKNASIRLENVSYYFPASDGNGFSLKNISFEVEAGAKVAIVGENGSGKTTLIKVLTGLYPASAGKIYRNGEEVHATDSAGNSRTFSAIFQDYNVFPISLLHNITFAWEAEKESLAKANSCIRQIGLEGKVACMENGINTILKWNFENDNTIQKMSGGEEQKLALARVLYWDAPVIILDEPSASMDPRSEEKLFREFCQLTGEKTTIFISHRLASCRICDKVIVIDNGELIQMGRHHELCRVPGKYKEMWDAQTGQYR
ncbi:ATP-binding cassette domain-containing protein [Acetatifactor muris]|uniref:ATP-binding cassette domain-containing protein n=1 Tax=Acetatifactor muris TaxID=879566 RepID=UPI0023EF754B|nr:ABC transporter ATP-binding protein [Acetatifactor muris]